MSTAHFLPLEVHEAIIDQAQDDLKLLSTCASVCYDWLKRCRRHSFRAIIIQTRRQVNRLRNVFSANRELPALVRSVSILPSQSYSPSRDPPLFVLAASTLLPLLVNLCAWTIQGHENMPSTSRVRPSIRLPAIRLFNQAHAKHGANINTLHLHRSTFPSHIEFLRIVQSIPGLRHLRCSDITFGWLPAAGSNLSNALEELPLFSLQVSDLHNFLLPSQKPILVNQVSRMKEDALVMVLEASGRTLQDLTIEVPPVEEIGTTSLSLWLLQCEPYITTHIDAIQIGYHPYFHDFAAYPL